MDDILVAAKSASGEVKEIGDVLVDINGSLRNVLSVDGLCTREGA